MNRKFFKRNLLLASLVSLGFSQSLYAEQMLPADNQAASQKVSELPSPLNLSALLSVSQEASPEVLSQLSKYESSLASLNQTRAASGLKLNLEGRLTWREFAKQEQDHHRLALHLGKELYDFGKTAEKESAQALIRDAQNLLLTPTENRFRMALLKSYLDVLLADFTYRVHNEDMAVAYVGLDKARDKHAVNRISDVDLLKLESKYQQILVKRSQAEYRQRETRASLANLAGQPENLPDKLKMPRFKFLKTSKLETLEYYQTSALANNVALQSLKMQLKASQHTLKSAQAGNMPVIRLDAWGGQLTSHPEIREGSWRIDLGMKVPLYDGGETASKTSAAKASMHDLRAKIALTEQNLRNQVANVYFQLKLAKAERKQNMAFGDFADLYLDYSRGLYENEMATDLGDAMVRLSESNLQTLKQRFQEVLNWAQLDYLTGQTAFIESLQKEEQ